MTLPTQVRSNLTARLFSIGFVAAYVVGAWFTYFLWIRFQLVHAQSLDYLVLGAAAVGVPFWFGLRKARREQRSVWSILPAKAYLGGVIITALVGGALLETANGLLDPHTATVLATTVLSSCHRGSLTIQGAPTLLAPPNATDLEVFPFGDIDCYGAHIGDTIFISVKTGRFGRPWISGRRLQSLSDSAEIHRIHERHRAMVQQQNSSSARTKPR